MRILAAIAAISLSALYWSQTAIAESGSEPQTMTIPVYFLGRTGELLPTPSVPKNVVIELGVIKGSLGGSPDASLEKFRVGPKREIRIDIGALTEKLGKYAAQYRERSESHFELTPVGTQFARVSVGASDSAGVLPGLAVVFWDQNASASLVPLYCDRPCRLRAPQSKETFDVDSPVSGLVWMLTTKDQKSRFVHVRARRPHPMIVIAPPEALEKISSTTFVNRE